MGKLPLNDPRWCAMIAAIDLRQQQTGDLAVGYSGSGAGDGERQAAQHAPKPHRQRTRACNLRRSGRVTSSTSAVSLGCVTIYRRTDIDSTPQRWGAIVPPHGRLTVGCSIFGGRISTGCIPSAARVEHDDDSKSLPSVRPGPKQPRIGRLSVAQWLIAVAVDDPQRLQNANNAGHRGKNIFAQPDPVGPKENKDLRKKIRELLSYSPLGRGIDTRTTLNSPGAGAVCAPFFKTEAPPRWPPNPKLPTKS